ncbi:conserved hypothetical protein [Burkholderia diffusa]|uniref:hypothetical protein n=1 Tax=Burkholderia diffusa TaxID=488732 RepID=UPI001CB01F34|nr:hypothetical protein [Burkholderia diffusa]CAG9250392.1 conserved hypothetical protein [Burkholderia diffusa]
METQLHTGARASIDNNSHASTEHALPLALDILIAGFEAVGAAVANRRTVHEVDVSIVATRAIARGDEALRTPGICDEERRLHAKSTIDFAIFTGRPVTPCRDSVACLPSRGRPLGAMACAFASVIRSA